MTKEEKIILLKKMLKMNFKYNFFKNNCYGLCIIWDRVAPEGSLPLRFEIPEIVPKFNDPSDIHYYWWDHTGFFKPWWERHKAIRKTIKHLKKS